MVPALCSVLFLFRAVFSALFLWALLLALFLWALFPARFIWCGPGPIYPVCNLSDEGLGPTSNLLAPKALSHRGNIGTKDLRAEGTIPNERQPK